MLRGHHTDDHFCALNRQCQVGGGLDRLWQRKARQKMLIDSLLRNAFVDFSLVGPETHCMCSLTAQHNRESRAPRPCADDSDPAHPRFAQNLGSAPVTIRPIFCRCFQMTRTEPRAIRINWTGSAYS